MTSATFPISATTAAGLPDFRLTDNIQIQNVQFVQFSNDADSEPWMTRAEALDFIAECDRQAILERD